MQHAEIIAKLGGPREVAARLGIKNANTVVYWGRHGRFIPSKHWLALTLMPEAHEAGITLEALAAGRSSPVTSEAA